MYTNNGSAITTLVCCIKRKVSLAGRDFFYSLLIHIFAMANVHYVYNYRVVIDGIKYAVHTYPNTVLIFKPF